MKNGIEIRWHGRGGQGAKTAALLLADVAFKTGKHVQGFPEYGPERMGAPITAYNRISSDVIRVHSNIYDPDFVAVADENFWEKACEWQKKGWTIALHGLHHELHFHEPRGYYQLSHSSKTEWAGKSSTEQYEMLKQGYQILKEHGLTPTCFFAPCHTYDEATVKAIALMKTEGCPMYISDGYALHPYQRDGVYFLPTLFDTPHKLPMQGIYTFVYHPNNMQEQDFAYLEDFLKKYASLFRSADEIMEKYDSVKNQGILGKIIEHAIYFLRGIKGSKE